MAFLTDKTLFIHIQKTGGMSVRKVLYACRPLGRESGDSEAERHFGLPELRASHPGIESGRLSFGFVRHPVTWLQSRWAFAVQTGFPVHIHHRRDAAVTWMAACWSDDFNQFAENYLERYPGVVTQTMFRMLGLWTKRPVNVVGKAETLFEDLKKILDEAGEHPTGLGWPVLQPENKTDKGMLSRAPVGSDLRNRIMDAEAQLCERYSYS